MNLDPGMAKWLAKHEGEWNGSAALVQMIRETSNMVTIVGSDLESDILRAVSQKFGDHAVAQIGFQGEKAGVTGAFTPNRETERGKFVILVKELAEALGIPEGTAARLKKAVYRLGEAAIEWFLPVSQALEQMGWTQMRSDPCVWVLYGESHGTSHGPGCFNEGVRRWESVSCLGPADHFIWRDDEELSERLKAKGLTA